MNKQLLTLFLTVTLLSGQRVPRPTLNEPTSNDQTPSPAASPTIKVAARLLQVSVVVRDKKGEPVGNLTKDDFVVYDKGQEQKIRYFSKEANEPLTDAPALAEGVVSNRFINARVDGKIQLQPLPESVTAILL